MADLLMLFYLIKSNLLITKFALSRVIKFKNHYFKAKKYLNII